jgi:hypothetical protein
MGIKEGTVLELVLILDPLTSIGSSAYMSQYTIFGRVAQDFLAGML